MLVHGRVTPSIKLAGTHLYTRVERGTVRVKCLAQEHNIMSQARAGTQTVRSGDEITKHDATASLVFCPTFETWLLFYWKPLTHAIPSAETGVTVLTPSPTPLKKNLHKIPC